MEGVQGCGTRAVGVRRHVRAVVNVVTCVGFSFSPMGKEAVCHLVST